MPSAAVVFPFPSPVKTMMSPFSSIIAVNYHYIETVATVGFFYPLIDPIGMIFATSFDIPARWTTRTTFETSLYASGISSARVALLAALT